eukprot:scaffold1506_cov118-Isochrysis_galbana.AAC.1
MPASCTQATAVANCTAHCVAPGSLQPGEHYFTPRSSLVSGPDAAQFWAAGHRPLVPCLRSRCGAVLGGWAQVAGPKRVAAFAGCAAVAPGMRPEERHRRCGGPADVRFAV